MEKIFETAGRDGALDGFASRCEQCGMVLQNTVRTNLVADVAQHAAWHASKDGGK